MLVLQAVSQIEEHVNHTLLHGRSRYFQNLKEMNSKKVIPLISVHHFVPKSHLLPFLIGKETYFFVRACDVCKKSITTHIIDLLWGVGL